MYFETDFKVVTTDISMLPLERNSVSPERYCSNYALLSKSSFSSFVSFKLKLRSWNMCIIQMQNSTQWHVHKYWNIWHVISIEHV